MKEGIVVEYNGFQGYIKSDEEKYLLLNKDIYDNGVRIQLNDVVLFTPDIYKADDIDVKIARFIKKKEINKQ